MQNWCNNTTSSTTYIAIPSFRGTGTFTGTDNDVYWDNGTSPPTNSTVPDWLFYNNKYPYIIIERWYESEPPSISEEDKRRIEEEKRIEEERQRILAEEKRIADEKAKNLLLEFLDIENRQKYNDKKPLEISSKLFNDIKYHIPISSILGRIHVYKENKIISELCITVKENLPSDDVILAKFMNISYDEENMLRKANHTNVKENLLARLN